jgi:AraC family transcriptional regulator, positive regulator of tynA and feaB
MAPRTAQRPLRGSTPERLLTTAKAPASEQFALWREIAGEAFVPVLISRRERGPFMSSVGARTVGGLGVSRIVSQPQSVARTSQQIVGRTGDVFFLNLPLSDGTVASQDGRTARPAKGDFVLVDSTRPFELEFEGGFRQISIAIPHDCLAPLLAAPWDATAVRVPGDRGVGAVAAGALRALAKNGGPVDRHAARALADQIAGLVALALGGVQKPPASTNRALLLQAALDEVERSLGDPGLSPARVAERVGISTRYLHRLFADRGTSFGRWVLARRLERCYRDLAEPARRHWTVGDLARRRGFLDPSYFARAFRARYGLSPTELRHALTAESADDVG